jgi:hypothetical protein
MAIGRYDAVPVATTTVADVEHGTRDVRYLRRRTLADPRDTRPLAFHVVALGDRLDLVAARHLGDALAAWQIADANLALDPFALTAPDAEGDRLVVPFPGGAA